MSRPSVLLLAATAAASCYLVSTAAAADDFKKEDHVYELTDDNFQAFVDAHKFALIEFYAPWCGHCKALAPEYAKAATMLAEEESEIVLAKVDATTNTKYATEYGVGGYPTLKFIADGKVIDYSGERKAAGIVSWLRKKSGPATIAIESVDKLAELKEKHAVVVVTLHKKASDLAALIGKLASGSDDDSIVHATVDFDHEHASAIATECGVSTDAESIVLFKQFDEGRAQFDGDLADDKAIAAFVESHSLPLVVEFNQETAQRIFGGQIKNHLILFQSFGDAKYAELKAEAASVAATFKGKVIFVTINIDEPDHERISEFFGMSKDNPTGMRLIHLEEDMSKFKPDSDAMDAAAMRDFVQQFLDGKLKPHLLSEDVPEDWDSANVKVLVGKNFADVAYNKDKHVLVMFYAPWCGHCKAMAPTWVELGDKYADRDDVVIAKLDSTANELEEVKVQGFPTIKMFVKGDNKAVDYNGERNLDAISKFIDSDGVDGAASFSGDGEDDDDMDDDDDDEGDDGDDVHEGGGEQDIDDKDEL